MEKNPNRNNFILSSKPINCNLPCKISSDYFFYAENTQTISFGPQNYQLLIDGYVLPKSTDHTVNTLSQSDLIMTLFGKHSTEFIHFIKGQFIIVIACSEIFYLFTHRAGIKKVFIAQKGSDFFISDSIKLLKPHFLLKPDISGVLSYCIFNNHIFGKTFFENISYSPPASFCYFKKKLFTEVWFNPESLKNIIQHKLTFSEIAEKLYITAQSAIQYLQKEKICLTLTGGMDSRLALSTVLKNNISPFAFVYGNPSSKDVITSKKTGEKLNIPVFNYFLDSKNEYSMLVNDIIEAGYGMINLHRAHRLFAYKSFSSDQWHDGIIFTGHMGGEMIRNFCNEGLIINDNMKYFIQVPLQKKRMEYLQSIAPGLFLKMPVFKNHFYELSDNKYLNSSPGENEFTLSFNLLINVHHAQDLLLSETYFDAVYPFYMDDEVIDLLFETGNTFFHNSKKNNVLTASIYGHKFYCELINLLYPPLAEIPFGKRGYFTAKEYVFDNKLLLIAKRIRRYYAEKEKYSVNFSYKNWFRDYLIDETNFFSDNFINEYFNIKDFLNQLKNDKHETNESYWRKFSNLIFVNKVFKKANE